MNHTKNCEIYPIYHAKRTLKTYKVNEKNGDFDSFPSLSSSFHCGYCCRRYKKMFI